MSDDKPQIDRITFYNVSDYKAIEIPPLVVSLSGQNELGTTLRAYEKRIAELEAALRELLEAGYEHTTGYDCDILLCHYCQASGDYTRDGNISLDHHADCAYVKAHGLLGKDDA